MAGQNHENREMRAKTRKAGGAAKEDSENRKSEISNHKVLLKALGALWPVEPRGWLGYVKKGLSAACNRLKFQHFSSRALRRCFITRAIEFGIDFKTMSAWQGLA